MLQQGLQGSLAADGYAATPAFHTNFSHLWPRLLGCMCCLARCCVSRWHTCPWLSRLLDLYEWMESPIFSRERMISFWTWKEILESAWVVWCTSLWCTWHQVYLTSAWCTSLWCTWPPSVCSCSLEKHLPWTLAFHRFFYFLQHNGHSTPESAFTSSFLR